MASLPEPGDSAPQASTTVPAASPSRQLLGVARTLRPRQWTKNLIVLAPVVFAGKLFSLAMLGAALAGFVVFCALSGGVYLMNDLADLEADRFHVLKRNRPLASGVLSPTVAKAALGLILPGALVAALLLDRRFFLVAGLYVGINIAYSLSWKHVVLIDVFVLSAGFVLRVYAGALLVGVLPSPWLFLSTFFLSLFLALGKRRYELVSLERATEHRPILVQYSAMLIDQLVGILAAITVTTYALYTLADTTVVQFHTNALIYTVPFVLFGIFRYLYLIYQCGGGGKPEEAILTDLPLLGAVLLWITTVVALVYLR